jgi:regulatory protein
MIRPPRRLRQSNEDPGSLPGDSTNDLPYLSKASPRKSSEENLQDQVHKGRSKLSNSARGAPALAKPLTRERIRNIAEHYVGQRESSAQMLRAVLERRLMRRLRLLSPEEEAEERAAALPLIEAEIERLERAGVISDGRYAEMKARSALASGRGARRILRDLGQKGVRGAAAREALLGAAREVAGAFNEGAEASEVLQSAEHEAAETFARKKRLGPYRTEPLPETWAERSKIWRREAGAMVRAGFGVDTIRKVLNQEPEED